MIDELKTMGWAIAFRYAGRELGTYELFPPVAPKVTTVDGCATDDFTREDVEELFFIREGAKGGGKPWMAKFRLKDGRYGSLVARVPKAGWF